MSEIEYTTLAEFVDLPLLDADDPRCTDIESTNNDPAYTGEVFPIADLAAAQRLVNFSDMVPKGAVRHRGAVQPIVLAYFWRKKR
jgi:hypothetical protein